MKWKEVKQYEKYYLVSDCGEVKALKRTWKTGKNLIRNKDEHTLVKMKRREGYFCVTLSKDGKQCQKYIHKLVAEAFIPNPENKPTVNHIDGDKLNNNVNNLEWATYSENSNHALATGLRVNPSGARNGYSKPVNIDGLKYVSIKDYADKTGISYAKAWYRLNKKTL